MSNPAGCFYFGPPDECPACGGFKALGVPFCSSECAADNADRVARLDAAEQAQRGREDAFAQRVAQLRAEGHTYEEIETMLAGMPT